MCYYLSGWRCGNVNGFLLDSNEVKSDVVTVDESSSMEKVFCLMNVLPTT